MQFHADIFSFLLFLQKTKKKSSSLETFLFYLFIFFSPHQTRAGSGWHVTSPLLCVGVFSTCLFRFLRAPRARLAFFFFFIYLHNGAYWVFIHGTQTVWKHGGETQRPRVRLNPLPLSPCASLTAFLRTVWLRLSDPQAFTSAEKFDICFLCLKIKFNNSFKNKRELNCWLGIQPNTAGSRGGSSDAGFSFFSYFCFRFFAGSPQTKTCFIKPQKKVCEPLLSRPGDSGCRRCGLPHTFFFFFLSYHEHSAAESRLQPPRVDPPTTPSLIRFSGIFFLFCGLDGIFCYMLSTNW